MGESKYLRANHPSASPLPHHSSTAPSSTSPGQHSECPVTSSRSRPDATRISSLLQSTSLTPASASTLLLRSNGFTLPGIRSVSSREFMVLFTPAILPPRGLSFRNSPPKSPNILATASSAHVRGCPVPLNRRITGLPMDPFEPLGRALAMCHKRVRHVPFVPGSAGAGVGTIHSTFLESAGGVIVVICEPLNGGDSTQSSPLLGSRSQRDVGGSMRSQAAFARAIWAMAHAGEMAGYRPPPLLLVVVSARLERSEEILRICGLEMFQSVVHANGYEPDALDEIAELIFEG